MKPIFAAARKLAPDKSRIVFAEGEEERVLRAVQVAIDEKLARPLLVGRPAVIEHRISQYGLRLKPGQHYDVVNPEHDPRYREYWESYYAMMARRGITAQYAKLEMRRRTTLIARSEEHTSELQSLMRISYAVFCLKKKTTQTSH